MEILEKIKIAVKSFEDDYTAKRKELTEQLKNDFFPMLEPLFKKHPKIKTFKWNQYTPYFNDGEDCEFSTNFDYAEVNGYNEDDCDGDGVSNQRKTIYYLITPDNIERHKKFNSTSDGYSWYVDKVCGEQGCFPNPDYDPELMQGVAEFKSALGNISDDFYKDLFGDHKEITVSFDGTITVEEYEHD